MFKKIKFNLSVDRISINTFEQLQDNFSSDLLNYIENNKLSKWFSVRDMDEKAQQVSAIDSNASPMEQMKALCRVLDLEDDEDVITYLLEEKENNQKNMAFKQEQVVDTTSSSEESDKSGDTDESESKPNGEDWSGRDLIGRDFTGADLSGYKLSGANLKGANFTNANLSGCDLIKVDLTGSNLSGANLCGCDLSNAVLTNALLTEADFTNCNLTEAVITKIYYGFSSIIETSQRQIYNDQSNLPNYKGPNFTNAILDKATLSGEYYKADFTGVHAHETNIINARLLGATMKDADFSFSEFTGSKLSEEQKEEAKMFGVKLV